MLLEANTCYVRQRFLLFQANIFVTSGRRFCYFRQTVLLLQADLLATSASDNNYFRQSLFLLLVGKHLLLHSCFLLSPRRHSCYFRHFRHSSGRQSKFSNFVKCSLKFYLITKCRFQASDRFIGTSIFRSFCIYRKSFLSLKT